MPCFFFLAYVHLGILMMRSRVHCFWSRSMQPYKTHSAIHTSMRGAARCWGTAKHLNIRFCVRHRDIVRTWPHNHTHKHQHCSDVAHMHVTHAHEKQYKYIMGKCCLAHFCVRNPALLLTNMSCEATASNEHALLHIHFSIYTSIHPLLRSYIHTYIRTYVRTYIHTYIPHTYIHTCIHTYIHTYSTVQYSTVQYITVQYIHTYIHTFTHTHTYIHAYIHTYIHTFDKRNDAKTHGKTNA